MAHFAKVVDGVVTDVIVAEPEFFQTFKDTTPGRWVKTSYNMKAGVYWNHDTDEPHPDQSLIDGDEARERMNYASAGFLYDAHHDKFYEPQPYESWTLETSTTDGSRPRWIWNPPYDLPADAYSTDSDGYEIAYQWEEERHQELGEPHGWVRIDPIAAEESQASE